VEYFLDRPDGCKIFYTIDDYTDPWRKAETILFVHGLAESGEAWRAWVPHFARHYRVYASTCAASAAPRPCPAHTNGPWMNCSTTSRR
jgi:3-oxoadipate enol-lactonase